MGAERYVLLGLSQARSPWFREVARWSTAGSLPIELVKTMSAEEVRARLRSGRAFSALLVDDGVPGLDRDLLDLAVGAGCSVIVVDSGRGGRRWTDLGASATVPPNLDADTLLQLLVQVAQPLTTAVEAPFASSAGTAATPGFRGRLVAVTGPGGTGRSTLAIALAQAFADDPTNTSAVCLADLALHAEQAMLHGSPDVVPGLSELVEAHRLGTPEPEAVQSLTWHIERRGYDLLLGLRRHRDWTALRARSLAATLDGLLRSYRVTVADVDDDLEGERSTGSVDVEERNALARTTIGSADLVVVVGGPGMKGLHAMVRTTRHVLDHGVPAGCVLPVVNRAPRSPRARAELTKAFASLLGAMPAPTTSPVFTAERRQLDTLLRDGARLPESWARPVAAAVRALLDRSPSTRRTGIAAVPAAVVPGTLGTWTDAGREIGEAG